MYQTYLLLAISQFAQIHVHCVSDTIQPSHPLLPHSPPALNFAQHPALFQEWALHIRWSKYWNLSLSISPSNEHLGLIFFRIDWCDLFVIQGTLKSLLQHCSFSNYSQMVKKCLFHKWLLESKNQGDV